MNQATTATLQAQTSSGGEFPTRAVALDTLFADRPTGPLQVTDNFAVLDDPVEQTAFTQYAEIDGKPLAQSVLMVQGMYCAACADTVEGALCSLPGVVKAEVHAATRRLTVQWDPALTLVSTLAQAVGRSGYRLLPMQEALSITQRMAESRQVLWRLGVAGICMMQVMMYAWPAYVTEPGDIPPDIEQLLRWASWVLSVPVVLFSCGPFFSGAWRDMKQGRVGMDTPVTIGIVVTFVASSLATFDPSGPWGNEVWFDSLTMFVFFLLGGRYLEFKARDRTAGALDNLMNRLPEVCDRRKPDGSFEPVSVRRLVVNDTVRVQAGQAFPGDGTLTVTGATVDEALLTGESNPVLRAVGETVVAGSFNLAGPVELRVDRLGRDTRFAQIVSLMERASTDKPRLAVLADRIAGPFLTVVLLAALAAGAYWWQIDHDRALAVAVAVLIVTCPCALSLATPAAMLASAGTLARQGVLVRRLQAFETLAQVHTVVFDKTGTLTHDKLQLESVHVRDGIAREEALALASTMAGGSLHPASKALALAGASGWGGAVLPSLELVSSAEIAGQGLVADVKGWGLVRLGSASFCAVSSRHSEGADSPRVYLSDGFGWLATFELDECLRDDAVQALSALKAAGVTTWLLSGDLPEAAQRVARAVGVDHVVSGASPEQKLQEIARLQQQGLKVAMVGDGLNDGPVLARADTSFALGTAAPLAQAHSDYVIQSGRLMDVANAVTQARSTMHVVHQNLAWAAAYNAICVPLALLGYMPPWAAGLGMAASSFWVIGNALRLNRPVRVVPI